MLADAYDCVVFDCDGVLWSGGETVAQAKATLDALKAQNKKVYFMSNNSSRGPDVFRTVFESHGLGEHVKDERFMWNSVTAAQRWFKGRKTKKAYVVGCAALKDAIRGAGVTVVEPWKQMGATPEKLAEEAIDPAIDAVVLAFDKDYGYFEICYATRCLLENKGCELVATNRDFQFPAQKNRKLPGNGAFVAAVCAASRREPDVVVGKPSRFALDSIIADAGVSARRTLMVGDMWSDVEFAHNAGCDALLVLSGVASLDDAQRWRGITRPDFVAPDLTALLRPVERFPPAPSSSSRRWLLPSIVAAAAVAFLVSRRRGGAAIERSDLDDATRWLTAK